MTTTSETRAARLEDEPLRLAGPRPGFARGTLLSIRDIYAHRELLGLLVRREIRAKYKDSTLGFFWSLAKPLAMLLVYYIAIGKFLGAEASPRNPGGIPQFAIFIFTGLTAWQLFSDIVIGSTGSIVANAGLIKKVYLPREVFPLSVLGSSLFNFTIQLSILVGATAVVGGFPLGGRWLYFPLALGVLIIFATAVGMFLAAVNVYLRDIQYLVEILLMVLFWASPIVYSWALVHDRVAGTLFEQLYLLNPMTQVIIGFQNVFWVAGDGQLVPEHMGRSLAITLGVSVCLLWLSQRTFARLQSNFAQEL
ncbi:ABC transporter permease [Actinotalea sp. K2]|uniref:ABC transporter permease n=1 Tax=Actinotalea sp. K2 TaxID=2939438 RepID=UPI0020171707|nr:ABC transporter permease [Actinotalea sp. K2]MCL3862723.1 ABC transporter permease [Actinotalea sp. K2]